MHTQTTENDTRTPPEAAAYEHALRVWERYHEGSLSCGLAELLACAPETPADLLASGLRAIPPSERLPVAIGVFVRCAGRWPRSRRAEFRDGFLGGLPANVLDPLEAAADGTPAPQARLPVTLEEFPGRIWSRAVAGSRPRRLVSAAFQCVEAMRRLLLLHEDDVDTADLMTFILPSGDLPVLVDLAALSPPRLSALKNGVIDRLMLELKSGRFELDPEIMSALKGWLLADTRERGEGIDRLSAEARASMARCLKTGSLRDMMRTRRLGRLMFRLGQRRIAAQCAKVAGLSPWKAGWQFQPVCGTVHSGIRAMMPGAEDPSAASAWTREPSLACSSMTLPLWLADGVERCGALTALFNRAEECPWIFPRLQHVFQWHLALAGKRGACARIERIAPELAVSLLREKTVVAS